MKRSYKEEKMKKEDKIKIKIREIMKE